MGSICYNDWMRHDNREDYALIRYILFKCCKKLPYTYKLGQDIHNWEKSIFTQYKPIDYMQMKWIIDRANFLLGKWYNVKFLDYEIFNWLDEVHWVPEYFDQDWICDYKEMKNGKLKKVKSKHNWKEEDYLSSARKNVADKIIRRWKLYGRLFQGLSTWWWRLKLRFCKPYRLKNY